MFGSDDNQPQDNSGMMQAAMPDPIPDDNLGSDTPAANPVFGPPAGGSAGAPAMPAMPDLSTPEPASTSAPDLPTGQAGLSQNIQTDSEPASDASSPASLPANDDLINLKQQALQHLSPLVSHLDQTPEEKFRTTMMMIQASDDQTLIKSAFEAAQKITDEKARAQALLDVINEINYFTQHSSN